MTHLGYSPPRTLTTRPGSGGFGFDITPSLEAVGPMLLAVDAGNSSVSFAVFAGRRVVARFHAPLEQPLTPEHLVTALSHAGVSAAELTAVALASVGPHLPELQALLRRFGEVFTLTVDPDFGMPIAYPHPNELGVDRWVNALAAYEQHRTAVVVVDIGTATNFECVSASGEFLGGAICVGPQLSLDALSSRSSKLAHLTWEAPTHVLANDTRQALLSGAYYGHAAMIDGMVARLKSQLSAAAPSAAPAPSPLVTSTPVTVIGTGGFISRFAPLCDSLDVINPDLTLQGVQLVYERTRRE